MLSAVVSNIKKRNKNAKVILTNVTTKYKKKRPKFEAIFNNNCHIEEIISTSRVRFLWEKFKRRKCKNLVYVNTKLRKVSPYARKKGGLVTYTSHKKHAIELFCGIYGIENPDFIPEIFLTKDEKKKVDNIIEKSDLKDHKFIIIETGTLIENSTKAWPKTNWEKLISKIVNNYPEYRLIQISPGQDPFEGVLDISGETSFCEAARFIEKSLTLIALEGGLMHLAAAIPKKCIILNSSYFPQKLTTYPCHITLHHSNEVTCSPCGKRTDCPNNNKCMALITPEEVFDALKILIDKELTELQKVLTYARV